MADATGQLTSFYNTPELQKAEESARSAQLTAGNYASAASLLPQKLRDAVQEKLDYNRDLIEQKNKAMSEYFQAPSAARVKYENIWNPQQREALVAKERAQAYQPYANLVDIMNQRMGNVNDIISGATGAFGAATNQANTEASLAQQTYQNLFTKANAMAQARQNELQLNKPTGGGGMSLEDSIKLMKYIEQLRNGNQETTGPIKNPNLTDLTLTQEKTTPGLTYLSGPEGIFSIGYPRLYDPKTNTTIEYDGYDDPDYIEDKKKGFKVL